VTIKDAGANTGWNTIGIAFSSISGRCGANAVILVSRRANHD